MSHCLTNIRGVYPINVVQNNLEIQNEKSSFYENAEQKCLAETEVNLSGGKILRHFQVMKSVN